MIERRANEMLRKAVEQLEHVRGIGLFTGARERASSPT